MQVQIPDEDRVILQQWLLDDASKIEAVLAGLEKATPTLKSSPLAEEVAKASGVDLATVKQVVRTLLHMSATYRRMNPVNRIGAADMFFQALQGEPDRKDRFKALFERTVKIRALEVTGKAINVLTDNQNVFRSARTLSEIRPVFREDGLEADALLVLHQLKLEYSEGASYNSRSRRELFVAMDHGDLLMLKEVIERALTKHERLSSLVTKLELPYLESE